MRITRAKATALLNKGEMQLYDDSRQHPVRRFTARQLDSRVRRARASRDRARDLVRRQKLASRASTGSKRGTSGTANQRSKDKHEILADILKRFETRLKEVKKEGDAGKQAPDSARRSQAASRQAGHRAERRVTRKAVKKAARARGKGAAPASAAARKLTPKQALRRTRKVLETRQAQAREPRPWQETPGHGGQVAADGFQSTAAARRAEALHAGESRLAAIHGSIGTRDRITQGKRDSKGGGG